MSKPAPSGPTPTVVVRDLRKTKKCLRDLTDTIVLALDHLDGLVRTRKDIPDDVSRGLAKFSNLLEQQNDAARFFVLGVDFRTDNKATLIAKLTAARTP